MATLLTRTPPHQTPTAAANLLSEDELDDGVAPPPHREVEGCGAHLGSHCTLYCTVYSVQCTVYSVLYSVHYNVVYSVQYSIVYSVQYNVVHSTM